MSRTDRLGLASLIVAFFGIAALYLWPDQKWIGWLCLAIAVILVLVWAWDEIRAEFKLPLNSRVVKEKEKDNALSDIGVWDTKWREIASEFSKLPGDTRADWYGQIGGTVAMVKNEWFFRGGSERKACEALCKLAGAMLLKSPRIAPKLSTMVQVQQDDAWRWLYFLKENSSVRKEILLGDGVSYGISVKTEMQSINSVTSVSQRICIECAAEEI